MKKKGGSRKKSKGERRVEQSKSKSKVEIEGRRKKGDGAAGGSDRKPAVVKLGSPAKLSSDKPLPTYIYLSVYICANGRLLFGLVRS